MHALSHDRSARALHSAHRRDSVLAVRTLGVRAHVGADVYYDLVSCREERAPTTGEVITVCSLDVARRRDFFPLAV